MHPLSPFARALGVRGARYVLIGVSAANLYRPRDEWLANRVIERRGYARNGSE